MNDNLATIFYIDDVQVAYPAGVSINLGGLDLWANATPVWPPIATVPALGGVWDEATSAHAVVGSFGEKVQALATSAAVAAVQASLAGTLLADVRYVKGIEVGGSGTEADPWGPASCGIGLGQVMGSRVGQLVGLSTPRNTYRRMVWLPT